MNDQKPSELEFVAAGVHAHGDRSPPPELWDAIRIAARVPKPGTGHRLTVEEIEAISALDPYRLFNSYCMRVKPVTG